MARTREKKTRAITVHLTETRYQRAERIAAHKGFSSLSEYVDHCMASGEDELLTCYESLRGIFDPDQRTDSSESIPQQLSSFLRGLSGGKGN